MKLFAWFTLFIFLLALGGDDAFASPNPTTPDSKLNNPPTASATAATTPTATTTPASSIATPATQNSAATTTTSNNTATTPNNARPIVGKVIWVKGMFTAIAPDKTSRELKKGEAIYLQDTLETDKNSQAQIVFTDDTLMTFRPDTKFFIEEYEFNPQTKNNSIGKYITNLITGGFRTITGLIAKANPNDYKVKTPVATIGVRGTDYTVYYGGGQLLMGYDHGTPCLTNGGGELCLGEINKYAKVTSEEAKPEVLKTPPAIFEVPLEVQPAVYTAPTSTVAPSTVSETAPATTTTTTTSTTNKTNTPPPSSSSGGGFCILK